MKPIMFTLQCRKKHVNVVYLSSRHISYKIMIFVNELETRNVNENLTLLQDRLHCFLEKTHLEQTK